MRIVFTQGYEVVYPMQASNSRQKRLNPRKKFYSEVIATNSLGEVCTLLSINYSNSGIGLISFIPIDVGEVFELELTINDDNGPSKHKLSAEVVQKYNVSEIYHLGLQFQEELELASQNQAS